MKKVYKIKQPIIKQLGDNVYLDCPICQIHKVVDCLNPQFAYIEISKFRIQHEHYEGE